MLLQVLFMRFIFNYPSFPITVINHYPNYKSLKFLAIFICLFVCSTSSFGQNNGNKRFNDLPVTPPDTSKNTLLVPIRDSSNSGNFLTLQQCIDYALIHQPALNRSLINVSIAKATNAVALSGWLPQVSVTGDVVHYIQDPNRAITSSGATTTATANSFVPELAVSQALFSPSLLYAFKTAPLYITQARQVTDSAKIYLVDVVSKSYYNLLLNLEEINVLREDTARLGRNVRDAYHQYIGGIVDETDYEEAVDNPQQFKVAQLKQADENIVTAICRS